MLMWGATHPCLQVGVAHFAHCVLLVMHTVGVAIYKAAL
jgi:hypothetical protein